MAADYVSDTEEIEGEDKDTSDIEEGVEEDVSEESASDIEKKEDIVKTAKRMHQPDKDESEEPKQKAKKLPKEFFKPPTAEEMNQLRETENLFHSNLFRLQIEEMLKEVSVKPKYKKKFGTWFEEFKSFLGGLETGNRFQLSSVAWLQKLGIKLPIDINVEKYTGHFQFVKPTGVVVIGSYAADCRLGPNIEIDVKVEIPQQCLLRSDYLNRHILLKRALYTAHLASQLGSWAEVDGVKFSLLEGDPLKPVVQLTPVGKLGKYTTIRIIAVPPEDFFKLSQLHPNKCNVKSKFVLGSKTNANASDVDDSTPLYNRSLAVDLVMGQNEQMRMQTLENQKSLQEGIMLLKVWLRQRGLDQGYEGFSGYLMSMYVLYLLRNRRLNTVMSSYQIIRNAWTFLAQADWSSEGISLAGNSEGPIPLSDFHLFYKTVFTDITGFVNLSGNLSLLSFLNVKRESDLAVKCLDNPNINSFQVLFMTKMPFYRQFDHVIRFHDLKALEQAENRVAQPSWQLDCTGPWKARKEIVALLRKGLGHRITQLAVDLQPVPVWSINKPPPNPRHEPLTLGLTLDPEHAFSLLEKGPLANIPEAKDFRDFWGPKCELRRFHDGTICEGVVWPSGSVARRRLVCRDVVLHLAEYHLALYPDSILYIADQLESVFSYSRGEQGCLIVTEVCDSLSRQLMHLENLPLAISSVQGSAACLRYSEPFPPYPHLEHAKQTKRRVRGNSLGASGFKTAKYFKSIPVVLTLGLSSKWPEDLEAIRRIKAAFYIKIAQCLSEQCHLLTQAYTTFVDVLKDGFVFRLSVCHNREISLLKETTTPLGQIKYKDTEESIALEMDISHMPKINATLHGMHMLYPTLGPASCLAKRWVAAHMFLDPTLMPETCVELIMASLFLAPEPYQAPLQPQPAFIRFLQRLAGNPWASEPLILNFGNDMPREDILEIENRFNSERSSLPALFIATPECRSGNVWTRTAPSTQVLFRLAQLARSSLDALDAQLLSTTMDYKIIFRSPLSVFDVVIQVDPHQTRNDEALDRWIFEPLLEKPAELTKLKAEYYKIPIVDLDLVRYFVQDLRNAYNEFALFFYDEYGGSTIGVLYKPNIFKPKDFKVSHIEAQKPRSDDKMEFNVESFLDDICVLGEGLVESIKVKGKNGVAVTHYSKPEIGIKTE